jgi:hypothetical protein
MEACPQQTAHTVAFLQTVKGIQGEGWGCLVFLGKRISRRKENRIRKRLIMTEE